MKEINNQVWMVGTIVSEFKFSHETFGEQFYITELVVQRLSGNTDKVKILVSERLFDIAQNLTGKRAEILGHYRSYDKTENGKRKLLLNVFARELIIIDDDFKDQNQIFLDGYICKLPVYRKTPLGREIADFSLAVNRSFNKSDYIPCICWGRNARYTSSLGVGTRLQINGRIQSREYQKKISDEEFETKTAYEVSISKMEEVRNEQV